MRLVTSAKGTSIVGSLITKDRSGEPSVSQQNRLKARSASMMRRRVSDTSRCCRNKCSRPGSVH